MYYDIKTRLFLYLIISLGYIFFMNLYAPLGVDWFSWHYQRIFNAVEFKKNYGLFSNFGFTIWNDCSNCTFDKNEPVYVSTTIFSLFHYYLINIFLNENGLMYYGPIFDKIIIFSTGILLSEIVMKSYDKDKLGKLYPLVGVIIFIFYIINPWTYKMFLGAWVQVYFLFFFLISVLFFKNNKKLYGLFFLFLAATFDNISSLIVIIFYLIIFITNYLFNKKNLVRDYQSYNLTENVRLFHTISTLIVPIIIFILLRNFAISSSDITTGSSLFYRIGIEGNDIHNGGILGALQFLGGNRITGCLASYDGSSVSETIKSGLPLIEGITIYNCMLSIIGMALLSLISIFGFYLMIKFYSQLKRVFFPIIFIILFQVCVFQQSLSVHLMGYSYFFSIVFSLGLTFLFINLFRKFKNIPITITFSIPLLVGISILCIRVSMLTGINGN